MDVGVESFGGVQTEEGVADDQGVFEGEGVERSGCDVGGAGGCHFKRCIGEGGVAVVAVGGGGGGVVGLRPLAGLGGFVLTRQTRFSYPFNRCRRGSHQRLQNFWINFDFRYSHNWPFSTCLITYYLLPYMYS